MYKILGYSAFLCRFRHNWLAAVFDANVRLGFIGAHLFVRIGTRFNLPKPGPIMLCFLIQTFVCASECLF